MTMKEQTPERKFALEIADEAEMGFWAMTHIFKKPRPEPGKTLEAMIKNDPKLREIVKNLKAEDFQNVRPKIHNPF